MNRRDFLGRMVASVAVIGSVSPFETFGRGIFTKKRDDKGALPILAPLPSANQLVWQARERYMFFHFGVNTFSDREWGDGKEDPKSFNPTDFNARNLVQAAKDGGFKMVILTAKHHDGFCLWPSAYTEHSVKNSLWKDGKGDVVREVSNACHDLGIDFGVYLSPWDRNSAYYGDSPKYNEYYCNQLRELLTNYGKISMVWFDGACGEGPNGKRQEYDWDAYIKLVHELAPEAVIFGGRDVRWIGNEDGLAQDTCWSVVDANNNGGAKGNPAGNTWMPAECDVSIRPGWFYHSKEDDKVKSLSHLLDIYYRSVGHNCCLHLNVPPDRRGHLHENDVARLKEFNAAIEANFKTDLALKTKASASSQYAKAFAPKNILSEKRNFWAPKEGETEAWIELDFRKSSAANPFDLIVLGEAIELGQRVAGYRIEALQSDAWETIARGTTIGYKWILRLPEECKATKVRLVIEATRENSIPCITRFGLYKSQYK